MPDQKIVAASLIESKTGDICITIPRNLKSIEITRKLLDLLEVQVREEERKNK